MDNYDSTYDSFVWQRPANFNFVGDVVDRWANEEPDLEAIHWIDDNGNEGHISFAEHSERAKQLANAMAEAGIERGDYVLLILGRQVAWWEVMTACLRSGIVVCPGTTQLSSKDIALRVKAAGAVAVITDDVVAQRVDDVADQCASLRANIVVGSERPGWSTYEDLFADASGGHECASTALTDPAICYFTSGTTGLPKMVLHNQGYGLAHKVTGQYWLDLGPSDLHWNISDTGWAKAAWSSYFGPWNQGATLFVHDCAGFDPKRTLGLLSEHPITTMCGAPTIYRMLVQQDLNDYDWESLRHCVGAGEPLNPEIIETWQHATGILVRDGYGQTESVILCGSFPCLEVKHGSMGKPAPGVDLQVIDNDGKILPNDQEGDIAVRISPEHPLGLFSGYAGSTGDNSECFKGDWYLTGDRAIQDSDGYFWFVGRADDVIISAGYRIGPFEVESALLEHEAVVESAVVASPDELRGEVVKAFVVLGAGVSGNDTLSKELQDHVKSVTAPYKYPRKIEYVMELPKTVSGKIRRVELRDREWSGTR